MYESVKIENYRAITSLELEDLGTVNLLVGKNSCGKTSILEAILILSSGSYVQSLMQVNAVRGMPLIDLNLLALLFNNLNINNDILLTGKQITEKQTNITHPRVVRISSSLHKHSSSDNQNETFDTLNDLSDSPHATPLQDDIYNRTQTFSTSSPFIKNLSITLSYFDKHDGTL